jgi:hypothetical protein
MVPDDLHEFFVASAGVAGALIGLLFVAISVSGDRISSDPAAPVHRIRAAASLTAFTNALTVSLFALIPGQRLATTAIAVAGVGLAFVVGSLLSLARQHVLWTRRIWEAVFLVGLLVLFVFQLVDGVRLDDHPDRAGLANAIAVLVVICFLIGVARAWELIGGPTFGVRREVVAMLNRPDQPGR